MKETITVLVPGTEARYTFLCSAFFEQPKAVYNRLLKALSADYENVQENVSALLEWAEWAWEERPRSVLKDYEKRLKDISSLSAEPMTKEEKKQEREQAAMNRKVQAFCNKKSPRPALQKPFCIKGKVYATDSYTGICGPSAAYTGEMLEERYIITGMPSLFQSEAEVKSTYDRVILPDLKTLKEWAKEEKKAECRPFLWASAYDKKVYLDFIVKAADITGSNVLYMQAGKASSVYMFGNGFSVIICPFKGDSATERMTEKAPALCLYAPKAYSNDLFLSIADLQAEAEEVQKETVPTGKEQEERKETADSSSVPSAQSETVTFQGCRIERSRLQDAMQIGLYFVKGHTAYAIEQGKRGGFKAVQVYKSTAYVPIISPGCFCFMEEEHLQHMFPYFPGREAEPSAPAEDPKQEEEAQIIEACRDAIKPEAIEKLYEAVSDFVNVATGAKAEAKPEAVTEPPAVQETPAMTETERSATESPSAIISPPSILPALKKAGNRVSAMRYGSAHGSMWFNVVQTGSKQTVLPAAFLPSADICRAIFPDHRAGIPPG